MRKLVLTCIAAGTFMAGASAQTLFTYGDNSVNKQEFLRIYQKNSMNKAPDFSQAALREYLDLYSLFKMKVREAEIQKLDTLSSIDRELNNYRKQLAKNYLTDEQVTNRLVKEAYDRMKEEVHVAHILILSPPTATSADTVVPYQRIDSIYNAIVNKKADFAALAKQYSDDRGSKENGGDVGYISALQTIYPFENAAYNTPVGKMSKPFRTQFGYHIMKVIDRRPAKGEVKLAQIMVYTPQSKGEEGIAAAKKRIDSIQADIKKGVAFETLVIKYSDDKFTKDNGGVIEKPIGPGDVDPVFENAVFALKKPGDISQPIQTAYGFHIVKLVEKIPVKPFDSLQQQLKRRVDNDSRAQIAKDIYMDKIKQQNGFKEYPANLEALSKKVMAIPDTGKNANSFKAADFSKMNQPVFELDGKKYLQSDLMTYAEDITRGQIMGPKTAIVSDVYKMYVTTILTDFQENKLVDENPDFKNLMKEYRDGIMLFELMDQNVWGKASRDTTGLKAFYEKNKTKYMWDEGFKGSVYRFKDEESLKAGLKLIAKNMKGDDIIKQMNTEDKPDAVSIQHGHYEFARFTEVPRAGIVKDKASEPVKNKDGSYTVVKADDVFNAPSQKSLEDARGYVVAEYQDYLEKEWNAEMRKKYPMKVNEDVFTSMVKK